MTHITPHTDPGLSDSSETEHCSERSDYQDTSSRVDVTTTKDSAAGLAAENYVIELKTIIPPED